MDIYIELRDDFLETTVSKVRYRVARNIHINQNGNPAIHASVFIFADRIWAEDETGVRFLKNKGNSIADAVDIKEFCWIKLKSQDY